MGRQMTVDQAASLTITWLRRAVLVVLLISLAVIILRQYGVTLAIRPFDPITLAYLAGTYWLTK